MSIASQINESKSPTHSSVTKLKEDTNKMELLDGGKIILFDTLFDKDNTRPTYKAYITTTKLDLLCTCTPKENTQLNNIKIKTLLKNQYKSIVTIHSFLWSNTDLYMFSTNDGFSTLTDHICKCGISIGFIKQFTYTILTSLEDMHKGNIAYGNINPFSIWINNIGATILRNNVCEWLGMTNEQLHDLSNDVKTLGTTIVKTICTGIFNRENDQFHKLLKV